VAAPISDFAFYRITSVLVKYGNAMQHRFSVAADSFTR